MGQVSNVVRNMPSGLQVTQGAIQRAFTRSIVTNVAAGSQRCPVLRECKDVVYGFAQGQPARAALPGAILALNALPLGMSSGSQIKLPISVNSASKRIGQIALFGSYPNSCKRQYSNQAQAAEKTADIYDEICELMTQSDLQQAQIKFMNEHMQSFDNGSDENLFKKTIHQGYTDIRRQLIDKKLLEKHSQNDIDDFYEHQLYKDKDADIVQSLLDFHDIKEFRKSLQEWKKANGYSLEETPNTISNSISNKNAQRFFDLEKEDPAGKSSQWTKGTSGTDHKTGMEFNIWQKPEENGIHLVRSEMKLEGVTQKTLENYILQKMVEDHQEMAYIKDFTVIETLPDGFPSKIYYRMKLSAISFSERDCVVQLEKLPQPDGRTLYVASSTEHPDYPIKDKAIRMDLYRATMVKELGVQSGISILEFSSFNLGGWFPPRLLNMMMGSWASKEVRRLHQTLREMQAGGAKID